MFRRQRGQGAQMVEEAMYHVHATDNAPVGGNDLSFSRLLARQSFFTFQNKLCFANRVSGVRAFRGVFWSPGVPERQGGLTF